jgi:hypothetical protein
MGVIAHFSGDANISAYERGVRLHLVIEMKAGGGISADEARGFAKRVEAMTRGCRTSSPTEQRPHFLRGRVPSAASRRGSPRR